EYYTLEVKTKILNETIKFTWQDKKNSTSTFSKEKIDSIFNKIKNKNLEVIEVNKVNKKKYSPGLYDLTELQRDANKIYGFSAKETLSIMQKLYEHHKVLTYPRTDSRYLSSDIVETLKDRIKAVNVSDYSKVCTKLLKGNIKANKSFVDDSKVSDHHAIIPTEERVFIAKGNKINSLGWKETYKDLDDEETYESMPNINKNSILKIDDIKVKIDKTNPPSYLNEGTLLTAMEKNNLGTVATRADIIEKLFNSFLIEQKGKDILITSKGKQLLDLVPVGLKTPELTSSWENKLQNIATGKLNKNIFIKEMKDYSKDIVKEIKNSDSKFKHDNLTRNKCPECGKYMLKVKGKRGKMLVCEDRECNTRKTVSQITNSRCPVCHKKLELRGEGDAKTFICSCGHREKLSAYNKRKAEDKNKASKKDINKYLKNQNKSAESFNNPFAEALAKLKK
ncbi:MAG: DNA topoisomerase III, partial [Romboutsia sp.]|nr:DNA topoisomerase III [Romboutsia sp.]